MRTNTHTNIYKHIQACAHTHRDTIMVNYSLSSIGVCNLRVSKSRCNISLALIIAVALPLLVLMSATH